MTSQILERVVWSALTSRQAEFSLGNASARRFHPDVSPFAATRDNSPEALSELARLIGHGDDRAYLMQAAEISLPDTLEAEKTALGVMMVQKTAIREAQAPATPVQLTAQSIPEMVALAELTKPGPFTVRTPELGLFWGVYVEERLAAMAGTRLNLDGYREVSGICTHPDFRGRGLAKTLTLHVATYIRAQGDIPILHSYADNHAAIGLYRRLGFDIASEVNVAVVKSRG